MIENIVCDTLLIHYFNFIRFVSGVFMIYICWLEKPFLVQSDDTMTTGPTDADQFITSPFAWSINPFVFIWFEKRVIIFSANLYNWE